MQLDTPEQRIQAGLELGSLLEHPGWSVFMEIYEDWAKGVGLTGIMEADPRFPPAYYRGQIDGTKALFVKVAGLIFDAQTLAADPKARETLRSSRSGVGDTAE